ncbi:hypothetical protein N2152v2_000068 [Parachlorella kessleri]
MAPISAVYNRNGPYNVVITGSTKGVGRALAEEFVKAGDSVVVCSRGPERVATAVEELAELARSSGRSGVKVAGLPCNVARPADVAALADFAAEELGHVDLWINNAGTNAYKYSLLSECTDDEIVSVVETNMLGVLLCCKEAIRIMGKQPTGGHIFNMDGAGADGGATPRFAPYGATKRSLEQLGKSLSAELRLLGLKDIGVHNLSPGMVTTELLMAGGSPWEQKRRNPLPDPLIPDPREMALELGTLAESMAGEVARAGEMLAAEIEAEVAADLAAEGALYTRSARGERARRAVPAAWPAVGKRFGRTRGGETLESTDLPTAGADNKIAKFFINCLAERPDTVAKFLVPRIRRVPVSTRAPLGGVGQSAYIRYLTKPKAYKQIIVRLLTGARKNRFVPEDAA